ncbi:MAG: GNAT family N-acetyltransferase [Armatimonadota bacterium]|nr:GNAT family N-acetyltransferase [Armatimonadota bacterium]
MNTPSLTIRPLAGLADPLLSPLLTVYETAFTYAFREDVPVFRQTIEDGEVIVEIAVDNASDGSPAGFFAWSPVTASDGRSFLYLPYLAVEESYRGKGIVGAALWNALADTAERRGAHAVLLEVEMPEDDPECWARRIRFYQRRPRWPARLLQGGYHYIQKIDGRDTNPAMWLMAAAPADAPLTPDEAYGACKECFGEMLTRTEDDLRLESDS